MLSCRTSSSGSHRYITGRIIQSGRRIQTNGDAICRVASSFPALDSTIQSNPIQSNPIQSKRTLLAASSEMNQVETTKRERNQVRKCRLLGQNGETFNYQVRGHETDGAHEQEEDGVGIISGHVTKDSTAALFLSFSFYWIFFYSSGSKWKYSDADSDFCTLFLFPPLCLFAVMYIYIYIFISLSLSLFFLSI